MASLERLPADQRAVLSLVLQRGRSFDEIAAMLSIDRAAVRQRALEGLDAIGPQNGLDPLRRSLITDYLLGQLPDRVATQVRGSLAAEPAERAWARVVAAELAPLAANGLPEIPAAAPQAGSRPLPTPPSPTVTAPARSAGAAAEATGAAAGDGDPGHPPSPAAPPSSRRGGAILLGLIALVVVVVVVILVATGKSSSTHSRPSARATTPAAASSTSAAGPPATGTGTTASHVHTITLTPPTAVKGRQGAAAVVRASGKLGLVIAAEGLAPTSARPQSAYAVWLLNSQTNQSYLLGFYSQKVAASGAAKGALEAEVGLPANAGGYNQLLVTLETKAKPSTPGRIVLQGAFSE